MKKKGISATIVMAAVLAWATGLGAASHYRVVNGPDRLYLGHISYTEAKGDGKDPVVVREGQVTGEVAVLNLPLGPGDTVRTPADRRCEVQFDTGTIIRLDYDTELRIETINAQSLSAPSRLSNLALSRGRVYVMYREYDSRETFQFLTPVAALKLSHKSVAMVQAAADGPTDVQVKYGKVSALLGRDPQSLDKESVKAKERLVVSGPGQFRRETYVAGSEFETWNDGINARFVELHQDQSYLPKPLRNLPAAVHYFAQNYGNVYGEWVWADYVGYVWRPYLNRMDYPGWRPYYVGSWTTVGGQLYWVPDEPWGWVPYHLGIWQWDKKLGWVWLPGSMFAPAWVDWEFFYGYFGWRPWGLYDWFGDYYLDAFFFGGAWYYGWPYPGAGYRAWTATYHPGDPVPGPYRPELDQATPKGTQGFTPRPPAALPMPNEFKGALKNMMAAYKKGDPAVFEAMRQAPSQISFVAKADLNRSDVRGKTVPWTALPRPSGIPAAKNPAVAARTPLDGRQAAVRAFRANEAMGQISHSAGLPGRVQPATERPAAHPVPSPGSGPRVAPSPAAAGHPRFLDWNPDVKVARSLGVNIEYSSRGNEVRCPELKLTSSDRVRGADRGSVPTLGSGGISYEPSSTAGVAGSAVPGGSGSGPSGGSGGSSSGAGSRTSGGEGASGGSRESGGGKIKN